MVRVAPGAGWLRVDDFGEALGRQIRNDLAGFVDRGGEAGEGRARADGRREGELVVAAADVGLIVDAVENPLADVALEMEKEVADGVFVRSAALPYLLLGKFAEAGADVAVKGLHLLGGEGEEVGGDQVFGHEKMIACSRKR